MKRIYKLLFLSCSLLLIMACNSDDYVYKAPESLDMVSSDLYFKSSGGSGTVEVNTSATLTVTASVDWCTCTVNGTTVTATVDENAEKESRDAIITITDAGGLKSQLPLHQEGVVVEFNTEGLTTYFSNTGGTTSLSISSSSPYAVSIPEHASSWLSYTDEDGKLTFTCSENKDKTPRAAKITIKSGSIIKEFSFSQFEITDLIDTWKAKYIDSNNDSTSSAARLNEDGEGNLSLDLVVETLGAVYNFPCSFSDGYLNIQVPSPLGMYYSYYLFSVILSTDNQVSWDSSLSYGAMGTTDDSGNFILAFGDNGTWPDQKINGLGIWAFSSTNLSSNTSLGYLEEILSLVLYK